MLEKIIIKKVNKVICQFPLIKGSQIVPKARLCDILNLFGSLLAERIKARLLDEFPDINFSNISAFTTLEEIYNLIINNKTTLNEEVGGNLIQNLSIENDIFDHTNNNINSTGIDIEKRSSLPEDIFDITSLKLRKKLFSINEVTYSLTRSDPLMTLVGIFSAKESIKKAVFFRQKIKYSDIEINYFLNGKPFPLINKIYYPNLQISISHCGDMAISNCIFFKS